MKIIEEVKSKVDNPIFNKIWNNGGEVYLVGGAVRDCFIGRKNNDLDFCVTGFNSKKFNKLFSTKLVGNDFSVFLIDGNEFALARKERKIGNTRHDFDINDSNIKIEDDLKRRDFTINSIAINIRNSDIIDPYNGLKDIENKTIRHTSKAFKEDPLRVYRGFRFSSQLNFKIVRETKELMKELKTQLKDLTVERVFIELRKAINSDNPSNFFKGLKETNLLDVHFPELNNLIGIPQPERYHKEGDVFNHSILALDKMAQIDKRDYARFAALVHDLGKAETDRDNYPHHYGHEELGVEPLMVLAKRLKLPNDWLNASKLAVVEHMRATKWLEMKPGKVVRLIKKANNNPLGTQGLVNIVKADKGSRMLENPNDNIMDGFISISKRMFEEVNGKTIDYRNRKGKDIGEYIFQKRTHWINKARSRLDN